MPKLNLDIAARTLKEADEMRAVSVAKVKKPDMSPGKVSVRKPSEAIKLTRISQITGPSKTKPKENPKAGLQIPTAEYGGDLIDSVPKMTFKNSKKGTQGGVKAPSVKTVKGKTQINPSHRVIGNTIRRTEEGGGFGQNTEFLSGSISANAIEANMPKGMKSGRNNTPTMGKISAEKIGPESPDAGKVTVKQQPEHKTIPQIKKPSGMQADPSDGGDRPKSFDRVQKTDNVTEAVRSGVELRIGDKVKARFGIASKAMLERMTESYRSHGYKMDIVATGKARWKTDKTLIGTIWESIDAEFNFVPKLQSQLRKAGLNRFSKISQDDYNSLYESRQEFVDTLVSGYHQIEKTIRQKYTESLELMFCNTRFIVDGKAIDAEITTEAHSPEMALRQIRNLIQEQYGLDSRIVHIFVEGTKYTGEQIPVWKSKFSK